jgi:DNA helicase-2/ATP-dependent DNA helicase PcrA
MAWYDNLMGRARDIAGSNESPLRVVAGPGTGKTFALMRRVARLLEEGVGPRRILLVTFTRVAARDLESELKKLNVPGVKQVRKGTLHSFCFSTLHEANVLGLIGRVPRPLLSFEERFLLEDLKQDDFGDYYKRRARLKAFEAAWSREQDQDPGWPRDEIDRLFQGLLDEWLRFHQAMLLGELVPVTLRYLRDNPGCPERRQFDHVLVDEYQDLNRAEQSLIDLLSERGSLAVIGDEDQSIYESFRYAHPEGISEFNGTHEGTCDIPLEVCRRCPTRIVTIANELIQNNLRRTGRVLRPKPDNCEGNIHVVQWSNMESEAEGIAQFISNRIASGEFEPGKTLVLCSRRQFGYMIRDALRECGRSAHSFFHEEALEGKPKKLDDCRAQEAFTLLTLLTNPDDRVALRCWLGFGNPTLRTREYERIREYCTHNRSSTREALAAIINGDLSIRYTTGIADRYRLLIQHLERLATRSGREIFDTVFPADQDWAEPFRAIAEDSVGEWTVDKMLDAIRTNITQPELPTNVGYVRVMSLHKSKGLNADHVIVTGFIEGLIPARDENLPFEQQMRRIEEQRRLFYVAITRPKKTLVLSSVLGLPRATSTRLTPSPLLSWRNWGLSAPTRSLARNGHTSSNSQNNLNWKTDDSPHQQP